MKRKNLDILKRFERRVKSRKPEDRSLKKNLELIASLIDNIIKANGALSVPRLAIILEEVYGSPPYNFQQQFRKVAVNYGQFAGLKKILLKEALISFYGQYDKIITGSFRGTYSTLLYKTRRGLEKYLRENASIRTETIKVVNVSEDSL